MDYAKLLAPYGLALVCLIGPHFALDATLCGQVLFAAVALINPSWKNASPQS